MERGRVLIYSNYIHLTHSNKISPQDLQTPGGSWEGSRNARGVPRGVPRGVQNLSSCQCSIKISCRDKNRRPSTYKRLGGPGRGPGTPRGSLGGSSTIQVTSSTSSLVRNANAVPFLIFFENARNRLRITPLHYISLILCFTIT